MNAQCHEMLKTDIEILRRKQRFLYEKRAPLRRYL